MPTPPRRCASVARDLLLDPYGTWAEARIAVPTDDHYRPMVAALSLLDDDEDIQLLQRRHRHRVGGHALVRHGLTAVRAGGGLSTRAITNESQASRITAVMTMPSGADTSAVNSPMPISPPITHES